MMHLFLRSLSVVLFAAAGCEGVFAQVQTLEINTGWEFREAPATLVQPALGNGLAAEWQTATVPGVAHLDLLDHKLIPDHFYRKNETGLSWVGDASWQYRNRLQVSQATANQEHLDLVFEGIEGYAHVILNGHEILTVDNAFRIWRVDVKPFLKVGTNELEVDFPPSAKGPAS